MNKSSQPNLSATRGNRFGIGFFRLLIRCAGLKTALFFAHFVAWCYAMCDRQAFAAAMPYLRLRFPDACGHPFRMRRHFFRLVDALAANLCSAFAISCGSEVAFEERGRPEISGGTVVVLSHFGCWQAAMPLLNTPGHEAHIMARPDKNGNLDKFLALGGRKLPVINTETFSGGIIEAAAVLDAGGTVIIMGDRAVDGTACAEVPFFSGTLQIPLSPWLLAARCRAQLVVLFADWADDSHRKIVLEYDTSITVPDAGERKVRPAELAGMMERYAALLENACRKRPYSFFRFGNDKAVENPPQKL